MEAAVSSEEFRLGDRDGLYCVGDGIYKLEYPLKENQVSFAARKIESIITAHPEIGSAYYAIVPDKNYFVAKKNGYPSLQYEKMLKMLCEGVKSAEYINIFDCLSLDDYYRTDIHWRQEKLFSVVARLSGKMGVPFAGESEYDKHRFAPFYGVLAAQSAFSTVPDDIVYLTSAATENALVTSAGMTEPISVYTLEKLDGTDAYDVFLSGAQAVVTIENNDAKTGRELIIFRDSFGSSIAPLFIESYAKITLLDLRYIFSDLIDDYADFDGAEVLFLYSTLLINSAGILK